MPALPEPKTTAKLHEIEAAPRRHRVLHWAAFVGAFVSLLLLALWLAEPRRPIPAEWIGLDLLLSAAAIGEFTTRSGFHWDRWAYAKLHVFDFFAMAPALWFIEQGVPLQNIWLWLALAARAARVIDRALGDGFVRHAFFAVLEAFEEETTDRVMLRILARVEADLVAGKFGDAVGEALARNKEPVLARVRAASTMGGLSGELAHLAGFDTALAQAEENAYNAIVDVLRSAEVDRALRDMVATSFANMRTEVQRKDWKDNFRLRRTGGQVR